VFTLMLKEQLKNDLKEALKAGDSKRRTVIGTVMSVIKNRELDKRGKLMKAGGDAATVDAQSELTEEEIIESFSSEIKKRKESIAMFEQAGRTEMAAAEKEEMEMLMHYMPAQLGEEEIRGIIKKAVADAQPADIKEIGKVMALVMPQVKGKADGSLVSKIVQEEMKSALSL
jgi:uncharacterized protein YqeY